MKQKMTVHHPILRLGPSFQSLRRSRYCRITRALCARGGMMWAGSAISCRCSLWHGCRGHGARACHPAPAGATKRTPFFLFSRIALKVGLRYPRRQSAAF